MLVQFAPAFFLCGSCDLCDREIIADIQSALTGLVFWQKFGDSVCENIVSAITASLQEHWYLPEGYKKIEDIQVGDLVLAYDEDTGEQSYKQVVRLFRNENTEWMGVTVNGTEIISSTGHKYYLPETKIWNSAAKLKVGTKVLLSDGSYGTIEKVRNIHYDDPQTTYNFEVEDFHTYYASTGVLVHNMNGEPCNYTYEHGRYEDAPYHSAKGNSIKSPRPIDGQAALDNSVQIKPTSPRRIGYSKGQFVILDQTSPGLFHGHVPELPHKEAIINNIINRWRF